MLVTNLSVPVRRHCRQQVLMRSWRRDAAPGVAVTPISEACEASGGLFYGVTALPLLCVNLPKYSGLDVAEIMASTFIVRN